MGRYSKNSRRFYAMPPATIEDEERGTFIGRPVRPENFIRTPEGAYIDIKSVPAYNEWKGQPTAGGPEQRMGAWGRAWEHPGEPQTLSPQETEEYLEALKNPARVVGDILNQKAQTFNMINESQYLLDMKNALGDPHLEDMARADHILRKTQILQWQQQAEQRRDLINNVDILSPEEKQQAFNNWLSKLQDPIPVPNVAQMRAQGTGELERTYAIRRAKEIQETEGVSADEARFRAGLTTRDIPAQRRVPTSDVSKFQEDLLSKPELYQDPWYKWGSPPYIHADKFKARISALLSKYGYKMNPQFIAVLNDKFVNRKVVLPDGSVVKIVQFELSPEGDVNILFE